jgi:hypothetical protein
VAGASLETPEPDDCRARRDVRRILQIKCADESPGELLDVDLQNGDLVLRHRVGIAPSGHIPALGAPPPVGQRHDPARATGLAGLSAGEFFR